MRIVHVSDTHLGFFEYARIDPETGLNQREQDFYRAWRKFIDEVLADPPDLVIHAGDLFHTPRPTNRAIRVASEAIKQVGEAGVPFVLISGNHSTPRIRATGSIFETLALFPNVHVAYLGQYRRIRVGGIAVHCVPHTFDEKEWQSAFDAIELDPGAEANILVTHGTWRGQKDFAMGEFGEQGIPDVEEKRGLRFDYVALGHYHRRVDIAEHISYSGSTERTGFGQADVTPGYLVVKLGERVERTHVPVPARPMKVLTLELLPSSGPAEVLSGLERLAAQVPEGAIVDLRLVGISKETYLKLDFRELDALWSHCLAVEKTVLLAAPGQEQLEHAEIGSLTEEFQRFLRRANLSDVDRERLSRLGLELLSQQMQEE
jgi:exonuclease SbcD